MQYNRVVIQRNKLLKELFFHPEYEEMLDIWDMQLASYGREVSQYRREFIGELNELICPIHRKLSGGKEELIISMSRTRRQISWKRQSKEPRGGPEAEDDAGRPTPG